MLVRLEAVPVQEKEIENTNNVVSFIYDYTQREQFIKTTKNEWLSIAQELNNIVKLYPESKWADDSLFCLFFFTKADFSDTFNELDIIVIEAISSLVYSNTTIHLEKWTLKLFENSFFKDFHNYLNLILRKKLTLQEKYRVILTYSLAVKLRKKGSIEEASKILGGLKVKFQGTEFEKVIQDQLELIEIKQNKENKD
jgi:hypothetical protein